MSYPFYSRIVGTGSFLPQRVVDNVEIAWQTHRDKEDIFQVTGIRTRRWALPHEHGSMLAEEAARRALDASGNSPEAIDAILVSTTSPDTIFPATACHLERRLGLRAIPAFDVSASCSGFLYGLSMADAFIKSKQFSKILVVATEVKSRYLNSTNGESRLLFGDGAGAAVVAREERLSGTQRGLLGMRLFADGGEHDLVKIVAGGSRLPTTAQTLANQLHGLELDGSRIFRIAVRQLGGAVEQFLADSGITVEDISRVIAHQANGRLLAALAKRLKLPQEKMFSVLEHFGNTSSASLPIALDCASRQGVLHEGDLVLLAAFGGGLTWGVALLRW